MRDDQHQAYIRQLLSHLKKKKNLEKHAFFQTHIRANSFVRGNDASAST